MRSYRFLLSRRWGLFAVVVALLAAGTWWLGEWQFGRLDDRVARNETIRVNEALEPAPVEDVMPVGGDVDAADEWRLVTATGTYDADRTVVVRYRSDDRGQPGVDAVVPLVTDDGTAVVVDRGFLATDARSVTASDLPLPPAGEVTVVGWARTDGTGDSTEVEDLSTRAISSARIGEAWDLPVHGGFVDLRTESPEAAAGGELEQVTLPELDNGPHFFYGLQWWFFGVLAVFGFFYLAWDERRRGPRGERSQRARASRPVPLSQRSPVTAAGTPPAATDADAAEQSETSKASKAPKAPKPTRELTKSQAERLAASQARRRR